MANEEKQPPKNPLQRLRYDLENAPNVRDMLSIDQVRSSFINVYKKISGRNDGAKRYEKELFAFADTAMTIGNIKEVDVMSIYQAFVKGGQTGLSFADGNKLYLIVRRYKQKDDSWRSLLKCEISAHGKREMLENMDNIKKIHEAELIFTKDTFQYDAINKKVLKHEQVWPRPAASEETVTGGYARVDFNDGNSEFVVMSLEEFKNARAKSTNVTWVQKPGENQKEKVQDGGELWNNFYGEACKKTIYNRAFKIHHKYPNTSLVFKEDDEDDVVDVKHQEVDIPNVDTDTGEVQEAQVVEPEPKEEKPKKKKPTEKFI